jgi:uncharacterized HAD superfamily protein
MENPLHFQANAEELKRLFNLDIPETPPHVKRMNIVFDIDSTLSDPSKRLHYIRREGKKDFKSFEKECVKDKPIYPIVNLARSLQSLGHSIILITGRSEAYREKTNLWLSKYNIVYSLLGMRPLNDYRPDVEIKRDIVRFLKDSGVLIDLAFEDRDRNVKMYREEGIMCCQVAEGNY